MCACSKKHARRADQHTPLRSEKRFRVYQLNLPWSSLLRTRFPVVQKSLRPIQKYCFHREPRLWILRQVRQWVSSVRAAKLALPKNLVTLPFTNIQTQQRKLSPYKQENFTIFFTFSFQLFHGLSSLVNTKEVLLYIYSFQSPRTFITSQNIPNLVNGSQSYHTHKTTNNRKRITPRAVNIICN